jgi:drug/metabolite transporter (DMT)-like permease
MGWMRDREAETVVSGDRQKAAKALMALLWTSGYVVGALATAHTAALTVTFWRLVIAAPLMAAIAVVGRASWPRRDQIGWVIAVGLLLQAVQFIGIYTALQAGVPAGLVALLAGSSPVLVAIAGSLFFGEYLTSRQWLGSALGLLGVVLAVADEMQGALTVGGLLLSLLGIAGLVSGTLIQHYRAGGADPRSANTVQLIVASAFTAPFAALGPGFGVGMSYAALAPLAWLTLGLSIGAVMLFFWLLRHQKGGEATSFLYVVPSLTAIAAVPVLGQSLNAGVVVGLALGLVGVNLVGSGQSSLARGQRRVRVGGAGRERDGDGFSEGAR